MLGFSGRAALISILVGCTSSVEEPVCGDGALSPGERCDVAIASGAGACPAGGGDCDDGDPCTAETTSGDGCQAVCRSTAITVFVGGDLCCPPGADSTNDPDCNSACGNGVLETGESCDPGIASGAGRCPTAPECNDDLACTNDALDLPNGDPCRAACTNVEITAAGASDACCPTGGTPANDPDCAGCGDGVVGANETCDVAIATGPNRCPAIADCNDGDPCTIDDLVGEGTCSAGCTHAENRALTSGDGCCLTAFTFPSVDADCPQLGLGQLCNTGFDCASNRCEFFQIDARSYCTTGCAPQSADHEGGCPPGDVANWEPVCLSAAQVSNGGGQDLCIYAAPGPVAFAELTANAGFTWSFADPSQVHVWMIPSFADGIARSWRVALAPNAALDVAGTRLDQALLPLGTVCNAGGAGAMETCSFTVASADASERFWFAIYPQSGLGDYQITLTLE